MSARFAIKPTPIAGAVVIERQRVGDARGFLERMFCADELAAAGWTWPIAQINRTRTDAIGTIRGLHFQRPPALEAKLVACTRGRVFDVAMDLRVGSPTYGRWHGEELSETNRRALLVPPGCAHGFQVLEEGSELLYLHSAAYAPAHEGGLPAHDADLAIAWPLADALLSERDRTHPAFAIFEGLEL